MNSITGLSSGIGGGFNGLNRIDKVQPMQTLYGNINKIGGLEHRPDVSLLHIDGPLPPEQTKKIPFNDLLLGSIHEVNMMQQNADFAVEKLMTGGEIGTAEVLTALQKADIAFKMMMQVRNKLVGAWQEIQGIRV
ncbi:MAG: flagellar hook-basal body complex protein FliE [Planctomycetaceae bacterium]|jgi:flagellar hook-basal body complex protein FliE|nr:flagellar hook-basal body complex protein FliE [Planctomycetaceae bacterium]